MAELPGWDRDRLATARPADVAAARRIVFARAVKPMLDVDVPARIHELETAERQTTAASRRAERAREIEKLRALQRTQVELRKVLDLGEDTDG